MEFYPVELFLVGDASEHQLQIKASVNEDVEQVDKRVRSHQMVFMQDFWRKKAERAELLIMICNAFQLLWYKKIGR